jgi:hypothetical protein
MPAWWSQSEEPASAAPAAARRSTQHIAAPRSAPTTRAGAAPTAAGRLDGPLRHGAAQECADRRNLRQTASNKRRARAKFKLPGVCANCGASFERRGPAQKYCDQCRDTAKLRQQRSINRRQTLIGRVRRSPVPLAMQDLSIALTFELNDDRPVQLGERVKSVVRAQHATQAGEHGAVFDYRAQLLALAAGAVREAAKLPRPTNGHVSAEHEQLRMIPALMIPA